MNSAHYDRAAYIVGLHALAIEALARKATVVVDFQNILIRLSFREARLLMRSGNIPEIDKAMGRVKAQATSITAMPEYQSSSTQEPWAADLAKELGSLLAELECGEHTPQTAHAKLSHMVRVWPGSEP